MIEKTVIKHFKNQFKKDYPRAKFMIGEKVRVKMNAKSFQIGEYKNYDDDDDWRTGVLVDYGLILTKLKKINFIVIGVQEFEFITPKTKYCRTYKLSDGNKYYHIYENELIKIK